MSIKDSIRPEVVQLIDKLTLERDEQENYVVPTEHFEANMPEGLTPKLLKAGLNYAADYTAAGVYLFGQAAKAEGRENKSVQHRTLKMKMTPQMGATASWQREKIFKSPQDGSQIVKPDYVKVGTTFAPTSTTSGDLKKIIEFIGGRDNSSLAD